MKLPGLIDPHVHMRDPGATHKEDWGSGTAAALAGGFTLVLAMPNTNPPIFNQKSLDQALLSASSKAHCDFSQFVGAGPHNAESIPNLASRAAGLKMYLDMTYGQLRLDKMTLWQNHFQHWPRTSPMVVHAESRTMAAAILLAAIYKRPIHIAHVALKEEILIIKAAKQRGFQVTCEVAPHHLFLSSDDFSQINSKGEYPGRTEVRPRVASKEDQQALWDNLDVIDCFATDHAPHTLTEKDSDNPPPGFPGLETALPLLMTAVHQNRLTLDELIQRMYLNPRRIFNLPIQPDTWVELDPDKEFIIHADNHISKCGWTPFEGFKVRGQVERVFLRNQLVYENENGLVKSGKGKDARSW
jgi:carbamoyl-phosphate synthase/aspartate carbamoyltransferase/dihydroorotase